ncbi:AEC family transporter [Rhizobium sp. KVB221]|uniref:AEC family transporter n=1 Tax=Rhizobium setariae TaxID=2801340 RepID=A0A937CPH5_9HYPH|nr:AEC family transporter [Rhizobium setariae]MBL0371812.1 AEC family transporter [Rhizobium setariae]
MLATAQNVLPVFLMIFAGWLIVASGYLRPQAGDALSDFVFKVAVPVLLFKTLAEADFHGAFPVRLWIAYFSGVAITWAVAYLLANRIFRTDHRTATVTGVSSAFANTVFIGLPLVERTVGPNGLVALSVLIAVHLPVMMIASTLMIERAESRDTGKAPGNHLALLRSLGRNLRRNPLVFGIVGGGLWHLTGWPLAGVPGILAQQLSQIAGPAALLSLGMAMRRYGFSGNVAIALTASALKLLLLPAAVLVFATVLGLSPDWRAALVLIAAVPTGVNAWLIAVQFKSAEALAASAITLTTGLGVVSVTFWAWIVSRL